MTYSVQELALQYAEKLVAFHEAMQSGTHAQERELRVARNEMFDAQNALNEAAKRIAELNA
jgi:hypothetical protein